MNIICGDVAATCDFRGERDVELYFIKDKCTSFRQNKILSKLPDINCSPNRAVKLRLLSDRTKIDSA